MAINNEFQYVCKLDDMDGFFLQEVKNISTQRKEEDEKEQIKKEIENIVNKPVLRDFSNFTGKFCKSSGWTKVTS